MDVRQLPNSRCLFYKLFNQRNEIAGWGSTDCEKERARPTSILVQNQ